ncbi:CoA transferase subunit A [Bosea sp. (in: a-proteobacteria)]|uniref:CoA transferase subunit A n=1 Tax=Bosea sp. (in: a-proteobacteria) TaxID=1871050 RepID=UPI002FCC9478
MTKTITLEKALAAVAPGSSVAFGGGGIQRKPMAAARALAAADVGDLTVVAMLGGPDVDLLIGAGKVRELQFAFVGFDAFGLAPHFRKAREAGSISVVEYSEATIIAAFEAGAKNLPFLPTRFGLDTDILTTPTAPFRKVACPFTGEELLAVPALRPDVAFVHANLADRHGNAVIIGDGYADPLLVQAAKTTFVTVEKIVDELPDDAEVTGGTFLSRLWIDGVIEAPRGGGMTAVYPDYRFDLPAVLEYQKRASDPEWFSAWIREQ